MLKMEKQKNKKSSKANAHRLKTQPPSHTLDHDRHNEQER